MVFAKVTFLAFFLQQQDDAFCTLSGSGSVFPRCPPPGSGLPWREAASNGPSASWWTSPSHPATETSPNCLILRSRSPKWTATNKKKKGLSMYNYIMFTIILHYIDIRRSSNPVIRLSLIITNHKTSDMSLISTIRDPCCWTLSK